MSLDSVVRDPSDRPEAAAGLLGPLPTPGWSASAPPDLALSWLRAGATAPRRVSYAGTKAIALWGGRVEASQVRIYHEAPNATRNSPDPA